MSSDDMAKIESALKDKGVHSVKIDTVRNSLQLQYSSQVLSTVDIIQILRGMGFTVVSID
ncbi:MAG: hypothetical protein HY753_06550 [Nitrospirae bacterium]|nr:hypothetical protein [Nitrospirota bacterium]